MKATELPGLADSLSLTLVSAPFLFLALRRAARRLAPQERPADRWPGLEAALIFLSPVVVIAVAGLFFEPADSLDEMRTIPLLLGNQIMLGSAGLLAVGLARRRPNGLAGLGLGTRFPRGALGSVALVYPPLFFFVGGISVLWFQMIRRLGWEAEQEVMTRILALQGAELGLAIVIAILVGPFLEELLFRGFLQGFMAQIVGERWAVVCASALFARLHGVAPFPLLFFLSLFLGWLQQRTRSLWVPWSAHALHNAAVMTVALAAMGAPA